MGYRHVRVCIHKCVHVCVSMHFACAYYVRACVMYMYICVHVRACVNVCGCTHIRVCIVHLCKREHICMSMCTYVCSFVCVVSVHIQLAIIILLTVFRGELSAVMPKAIQPFAVPIILKSMKSSFFLHSTK